MTQKVDRARHQNPSIGMNGGGQQAGEPEIGCPSPERMRTANEVGSAIVHQLNGPLTALRLYVGEIRQHSGRLSGPAGTDDSLQQIVENAFQETERVCAMIRLIADTFEAPLHREDAVALGRDVISWWTRSGSTEASGRADGHDAAGAASAQSIHALLTPRQREVLGHISQGCSNKQGAVRMQIGPRTFESHRARVMRKFGAKNAADLVRIAFGENAMTS
jgi:DNA-binding CsgD family transcriptional regulator